MSPDARIPTRYYFAEIETDRRWIDAYWEMGYVILTGVFSAEEVGRMQARFDRWYAEGMRHPSTVRHLNKVIWLQEDENAGKIVRGMQWPSYEDELLDSVRTDPRMLAILGPLIGWKRRFYEHCGFQGFEEMPRLWNEANPCM